MRSFLIQVVGVCTLISFLYSADYPRRSMVTSGRANSAPKIDGAFDDKCWNDAAGSVIPVLPGKPGGWFKVAYDSRNIYFAIRCDNPQIADAVCEKVKRDGPAWMQESVEIFITTKGYTSDYFQFVVSLLNDKADSKFKNANGNIKWNGQWVSATKRDKTGWQVEVKIPFANLGAVPKPKSHWRFNVCRNQKIKDCKTIRSSFSATIGDFNFHQPYQLADLYFSDLSGGLFVENIGDLFPGKQRLNVQLCRGMGQINVGVAKGYTFETVLKKILHASKDLKEIKYVQPVDAKFLAVTVSSAKGDRILYSSGRLALEQISRAADFAKVLADVDEAKDFRKKLNKLVAELENSDAPLAQRQANWQKVQDELIADGVTHIRNAFKAVAAKGDSGKAQYGLAVASSMTQVLPEELESFRGDFSDTIALSACKGEVEAGQFIIYPLSGSLPYAGVECSDLTTADGKKLSSDIITVSPVGYVKTRPQNLYKVSYVGWWPDPILTYLRTFRLPANKLQSFWVSVKVPQDAPAGDYTAEITVRFYTNTPPARIKLKLKVWDFTLPQKSSFPTAVHLAVEYIYNHRNDIDLQEQEVIWDKFLAEHRTNPNQLYNTGSGSRGPLPDYKLLAEWKKLNTTLFNVIASFPPRWKKGQYKRLDSEYKPKIDKVLAAAKKAGMLDRAYIYGWDEWKSNRFADLNRMADWYKKNYPDIPLFTTARDLSYGIALPKIDWFCPEIYQYDFDRAQQARKRGKKVWSYTCLATKKPYPMHYIEYPLTDTRLLLGFMATSYKYDGYLYYSMSRQTNNRKLITGGPYLDWNPQSFGEYHGDGLLIYPGHTGPVTSMRMENWLDGLEDYEYIVLARKNIERLKKSGKAALAKKYQKIVEKYSNPGNDVVMTLTDYTSDPKVIERLREKLAEIILAK